MGTTMQYEFRLFGPRKGTTVTINGHPFVDGKATLVLSSVAMGSCMRVLAAYGAYSRGTPEYDVAVAKEEAENGAGKADTQTLEGADTPVRSGVRPNGERPAEEVSVVGAGDDLASGAGGSGGSPSGDRHEHAGVPKFPEDKDYRSIEPPSEVNESVAVAVKKLDPEVDSHWVMTGAMKGKPKLQAVEEAFGKAGLTRQDIDAALPGWDRDTAIKAALAA